MRAVLCPIVALAAFAAGAAGVRTLVPWPDEHGLATKLAWFEAHKDEFDMLFIGSSRVHRGIMPRRFDEDLAEEGFETRSFNLGIGGMKDFEADHVLRAVLAMEPARLRWVFVEAGRWNPRADEMRDVLTMRTVEWHTLVGTRNAIEAVSTLDLGRRELAREVFGHVRLFALRLSNHGLGPEIARAAFGAEPEGDWRIQEDDELARDLGWQAVESEETDLEPETWARHVRRTLRDESLGTDPPPGALNAFPGGAVRRQVELVTARVDHLVYLSLPSSFGTVFARTLNAFGVLPEYLAYDLPSRYPRLFELERRADTNHLNRRGARELTRILARDVARLMREDQRGTASR